MSTELIVEKKYRKWLPNENIRSYKQFRLIERLRFQKRLRLQSDELHAHHILRNKINLSFTTTRELDNTKHTDEQIFHEPVVTPIERSSTVAQKDLYPRLPMVIPQPEAQTAAQTSESETSANGDRIHSVVQPEYVTPLESETLAPQRHSVRLRQRLKELLKGSEIPHFLAQFPIRKVLRNPSKTVLSIMGVALVASVGFVGTYKWVQEMMSPKQEITPTHVASEAKYETVQSTPSIVKEPTPVVIGQSSVSKDTTLSEGKVESRPTEITYVTFSFPQEDPYFKQLGQPRISSLYGRVQAELARQHYGITNFNPKNGEHIKQLKEKISEDPWAEQKIRAGMEDILAANEDKENAFAKYQDDYLMVHFDNNKRLIEYRVRLNMNDVFNSVPSQYPLSP